MSQKKELKIKQNKEKERMKWRRLQSVFGKCRLKVISIVEYLVNGSIICTTAQLQIEEAMIKENTTRFY